MNQAQHSSNTILDIAISGASGLIGCHLTQFLIGHGHRVRRLVRTRSRLANGDVYWNPTSGEFDSSAMTGVDAVVHLAGENIAGGRWNTARKNAIRESRVQGTAHLCQALAQLRQPPPILITASAIGYYGDRGEESLTEESTSGSGFLSEVTRAWEAATQPAAKAGVRVVNVRIGVVLSRAGGALAQMLTPFKLGLGGKIGHGRQYISWIALSDLLAVIEYLLHDKSISGPVNAVAPMPVTNTVFTRTLGRVLHRPTILPLPAMLVRLLFGQMGRELLLSSTRVLPKRLTASGFIYTYADLEAALRAELAPESSPSS